MNNIADLLAPVGPVAEAFVADRRLFSAIMGPYGSAKTTSCIRKIAFESPMWQNPGPDGVRRVRWCVVRDTYQQLETNVMNSWFTWFPKTKANWNGREMCQRLNLELIDAATGKVMPVYIEIYFRAMGDHKAEDVLKGMELTGLWLNETDTLDRAVLLFGVGRIGRYPSMKDGGCQWWGIICDFNAPDIDNWVYEFLIEQKLGLAKKQEEELRRMLGPLFGIGYHRQPSGLSADPPPENIKNLPTGYYEGQSLAFANHPQHFRRFVLNEFGAVRNGQVVFPEFNDELHLSKSELQPLPDAPLIAGLDGGRTPALIFAQRDPRGQLRILSELVIYDPKEKNELFRMGPTAFADLALEFVSNTYPDLDFAGGFYDPAAQWDVVGEELTWIETFTKAFGGKWKPGGKDGNRLEPRLEAVRELLNRSPGGQPALLISPNCKMLRRGFGGGYVIERVKTSAGGRFRDKPSKNDFSHVQDALQYLCLGLKTRGRIVESMDTARHMRRDNAHVSYGNSYFSQRGV